MAVIPGPLGAVNAVYATIEAQFVNILTEIWPLYSAITVQFNNKTLAVPQVNPASILRNKHLVVPSYPAVQVYSESGDEYQDGAAFWGSWSHVVMVEWMIIGESDEMIQAQSLIYCEALWILFERYQMLDATLSGPHGVSADHYQVLYGKTQEGKIMAGGTMRVKVLVDENAQHA